MEIQSRIILIEIPKHVLNFLIHKIYLCTMFIFFFFIDGNNLLGQLFAKNYDIFSVQNLVSDICAAQLLENT